MIFLFTKSYNVDIRANIEVTVRLGRRFLSVFLQATFSTPFRNYIASSIRLIMI